MKKFILAIILSFSLSCQVNSYAVSEWDKTQLAGTINASDIDVYSIANAEAIDRYFTYGRHNCKITYASASTITVGAGSIVCSNSAGTVRRFRVNTTAATVAWAEIDTGSEEASKTYYLWAIGDADATTFTVKISLSSTAPASSTYYRRLGSFYNDASSNITLITNDNNTGSAGASYDSGWFAIATNTAYVKTHNLGTTKCLITLLVAKNDDGSGWCYNCAVFNELYGTYMAALSTTTITLRTGATYIISADDIDGDYVSATTGYARIIMLAIE